METRCNLEKGYFQFVFIGDGSGISNGMKVILPLKSPETCKQAECTVTNDKMECIMDANKYDLSGDKIVEVYEEEPEINNFRIPNWKEFFTPETEGIMSILKLNNVKLFHLVEHNSNDMDNLAKVIIKLFLDDGLIGTPLKI